MVISVIYHFPGCGPILQINTGPLYVGPEELRCELVAIPYPDGHADLTIGKISQWATAGLDGEMAIGSVELMTECIFYGIIGGVIQELTINSDSVAEFESVLVMPEGDSVLSLIAKTTRGDLRRLQPSLATRARCIKIKQIYKGQDLADPVNRDHHPSGVTGDALTVSALLETLKLHLRNRFDIWIDVICRLPGGGFPGRWVDCLTRNVMPLIAACNAADLTTFRHFCGPLSKEMSIALDGVEQALIARWSGLAGVRTILARRNLIQALQEYPLLSFGYDLEATDPLFDQETNAIGGIRTGKLFDESTKDRATALLHAIQTGAPLARELCRTLECPKWIIRRFHYMPMIRLAEFRGSVPTLAQDLAAFGPDLAPGPERYFDMWEAMHSFGNEQTWGLLKPAIEQCRVQRNYRPLIALMHREVRININDYLSFISNLRAVLPHNHDDSVGLTEALGNPSLDEWMDLSHLWHDADVRAQRRLALADEAAAVKRWRWPTFWAAKDWRLPAFLTAKRWLYRRWKPLFKGSVVVDGYDFKVLRNARELKEEGMALEHCVGNYADLCANGRTHIISMRMHGHRVATLQFNYELSYGQQWVLRLVQARGKRNKAPEGAAAAAIQQLARKIFGGEIQIDPRILKNLIKALSNRQGTGSKLRFLPKFSELAIAIFQRIMDRWIYRGRTRWSPLAAPVNNLFTLAEIDQQLALNLYRPCLEANPGAGTFPRMLEAYFRAPRFLGRNIFNVKRTGSRSFSESWLAGSATGGLAGRD